jgi:hypothetical protein
VSKTKISEFSQTASQNTDINSININEGCPPSTINNAIRELMKQIKDFQIGASGDGLTVSTLNATTATLGAVSATSLVGTSANISGALTTATASITTATISNVINSTISGSANTLTVDGVNSVGFRAAPAVGTKTSSYTLQTGDVGKYVQVGSSGSITIPDATFSEGDVISIFNNTSGNITITCSITTAYIAGTNTDKDTMTLATRGIATVLFISGTVCVVTGTVT